MPCDLQDEVAVSALVQHLVFCGLAHGQPTEDEWSRTESQVLLPFLTLQPHDTTAFCLPQLLFRNHKLRQHSFQRRSG
jgi:hypothetical protein